MTAVLDATSDVAAEGTAEPRLASWPARAAAFAIDVLVDVAVVATMALLALSAPPRSFLWWVFTGVAAVTVLAMLINRWLLPSLTGWSIGRAVFAIRVVSRDAAPAGVWRLLARDVVHLLDTAALCVGWLWPLWDRRRRTFADLVARSEVHRVAAPDHDARGRATMSLLAAALTCVMAAGLSYLVVYQQDRAADAARAQIAEQGPRIVEQVLTYRADTLQEDFARAQGLVTGSYWPQLAAQQRAVQHAGATTNEYWAVSSAVLPDPTVTPQRASMLLAMQGQRGADPKDLKFITATVRADFEKSGDRWRVANLTVLKKPHMGAGQ